MSFTKFSFNSVKNCENIVYVIIILLKLFIPSFSFHRHKLIIGSYNKDLKIKKAHIERGASFYISIPSLWACTHISMYVVSLVPLKPSCLHQIHIILPVSTLEYPSHSFCRSVGLKHPFYINTGLILFFIKNP